MNLFVYFKMPPYKNETDSVQRLQRQIEDNQRRHEEELAVREEQLREQFAQEWAVREEQLAQELAVLEEQQAVLAVENRRLNQELQPQEEWYPEHDVVLEDTFELLEEIVPESGKLPMYSSTVKTSFESLGPSP